MTAFMATLSFAAAPTLPVGLFVRRMAYRHIFPLLALEEPHD